MNLLGAFCRAFKDADALQEAVEAAVVAEERAAMAEVRLSQRTRQLLDAQMAVTVQEHRFRRIVAGLVAKDREKDAFIAVLGAEWQQENKP